LFTTGSFGSVDFVRSRLVLSPFTVFAPLPFAAFVRLPAFYRVRYTTTTCVLVSLPHHVWLHMYYGSLFTSCVLTALVCYTFLPFSHVRLRLHCPHRFIFHVHTHVGLHTFCRLGSAVCLPRLISFTFGSHTQRRTLVLLRFVLGSAHQLHTAPFAVLTAFTLHVFCGCSRLRSLPFSAFTQHALHVCYAVTLGSFFYATTSPHFTFTAHRVHRTLRFWFVPVLRWFLVFVSFTVCCGYHRITAFHGCLHVPVLTCLLVVYATAHRFLPPHARVSVTPFTRRVHVLRFVWFARPLRSHVPVFILPDHAVRCCTFAPRVVCTRRGYCVCHCTVLVTLRGRCGWVHHVYLPVVTHCHFAVRSLFRTPFTGLFTARSPALRCTFAVAVRTAVCV